MGGREKERERERGLEREASTGRIECVLFSTMLFYLFYPHFLSHMNVST